MLGDTMPDQPVAPRGTTRVCLQLDAVTALEEKCAALGAGGEVTFPARDLFWGAKFGMLTDAFGVRWMFNFEQKRG